MRYEPRRAQEDRWERERARGRERVIGRAERGTERGVRLRGLTCKELNTPLITNVRRDTTIPRSYRTHSFSLPFSLSLSPFFFLSFFLASRFCGFLFLYAHFFLLHEETRKISASITQQEAPTRGRVSSRVWSRRNRRPICGTQRPVKAILDRM